MIRVHWGPYFRADVEEQQKVVALVQEALGAKNGQSLITLEVAVTKIADMFGIDDVDELLAELESERTKKADEAAEREAEAMHSIAQSINGQDAGRDRPGSRGDSAQAPFGRGRGPAAPAEATEPGDDE